MRLWLSIKLLTTSKEYTISSLKNYIFLEIRGLIKYLYIILNSISINKS